MSPSLNPLVSVITIFFEAERFLDEAIRSVLAQTYEEWELILVDDGSTDGGGAIARAHANEDPRIRSVTHEHGANRGMSASRNVGLGEARGDLVAFLDADDVWLPEKLTDQVRLMAENPDVGMLYGRTQAWYGWTGDPADVARDHLHDSGVPLDTVIHPPSLLTKLVQESAVPPYTCSIMLRRQTIERLGGFEDAFRGIFEDQVFFAKVFLHERVLVSSRYWDRYRQHEAGACAVAYKSGEAHPVDISPARGAFLEWLATYLRRVRPNDRKLHELFAQLLRPYRFPTAPVEIVDVTLVKEGVEDGRLRGCHIDFPTDGQHTGGHAIEILGWAIGRSSPVVAVEIVEDGQVVLRTPLDQPRADLAAAFPDVPEADRCGFRTSLSVVGMTRLRLELQAVLRNQARVPLAVITANRRWTARDLVVGSPLISAVIIASEEHSAAALAGTIESVLEQTYPQFEVVLVDRGPSGGVVGEIGRRNPGARVLARHGEDILSARNAGLGASRGAHLIFLDPGDRLLPDALERAAEELIAQPSCSWVGEVTASARGGQIGGIGGILFQRVALARGHGTLRLDSSRLEHTRSRGHAVRLLESDDRPRDRGMNGGRRSDPEVRAAVLLFHRVADLTSDPWGLSVSPERFAEQLEFLGSEYRALALHELVQALDGGRIPERSVVVTFDDGYADNLEVASPLLEAHGVPATFFLASGYIGSDREFWWDELDRLLLQPGVLPPKLELELGGTVLHRGLEEWEEYPEEMQTEHRTWRAWDEPPTARHALYRELYFALQPLGEEQRSEALTALHSWAGQTPGARASHRVLTEDEVRALNRLEEVEIGAHTVTHPRLSSLSPAEQQREIVVSKQGLEEILEAGVTSFSYPHGSVTTETTALVERAGFVCACAADRKHPISRASRFELPRGEVCAWWGSSDLAVHLNSWFER